MSLRSAGAQATGVSGVLSVAWKVALLGVVAGLAKTYFDPRLGLPGHSVIWWFTPILAAKVLTRSRLAATGASVTAGGVIMVLSSGTGRFLAPVEFAASGFAADLLLGSGDSLRQPSALRLFPVAVLSGIVANLARFGFKVLLFSRPGPRWRLDAAGLAWRVGSYVLFGAVCGLLAATIYFLSRRRTQNRQTGSDTASG
ncbi:MAG: hypothetical protein V2A58_09500 [Planctomycetota bacterium]